MNYAIVYEGDKRFLQVTEPLNYENAKLSNKPKVISIIGEFMDSVTFSIPLDNNDMILIEHWDKLISDMKTNLINAETDYGKLLTQIRDFYVKNYEEGK